MVSFSTTDLEAPILRLNEGGRRVKENCTRHLYVYCRLQLYFFAGFFYALIGSISLGPDCKRYLLPDLRRTTRGRLLQAPPPEHLLFHLGRRGGV